MRESMSSKSAYNSLLDTLEGRKSLKGGSEVHLNIYDMLWINDYTSQFGIGAFHSGLEVHGAEYAYGGHPYSFTGVYQVEPRKAADVAGPGLKFRESIQLGHTSLTRQEVLELVHSIGKQFNGNSYHILNKNCNHFSEALSRKLTGVGIPSWVNRLAYIISWMPFILNCLPPSWLSPGGSAGGGQGGSPQVAIDTGSNQESS